MRNQVAGDIGWRAEHEVQYTWRQACIMQCMGNVQRAGRRFFGRLEDDRAARRNSTCHFAARLAHREVPRRECGDRADRLVMHNVANARRAGDDPTVRTRCLAGIPLEELATTDHFEPCLRQRLAMLGCDCKRDLFLPLAHEGSRLVEDVGAIDRCRVPPDFETFRGGREGIVEIALIGVRQTADLFLRRRVNNGHIIGGLAPLATYIEV